MRSDALYLGDIVDAIEAVERFTLGVDESRFIADEMVQSAVLQKLAVMGEAAARLSAATREAMPTVPWKAIVGFRNVAVHAYFSVDWRVVFVTVVDDLPSLKAAVAARLQA